MQGVSGAASPPSGGARASPPAFTKQRASRGTPMNHASQWRIELARDIAGWYTDQPNVRMIALGGSAARGLADAYSDMDMAVYWEELDRAWLAEPPLRM